MYLRNEDGATIGLDYHDPHEIAGMAERESKHKKRPEQDKSKAKAKATQSSMSTSSPQTQKAPQMASPASHAPSSSAPYLRICVFGSATKGTSTGHLAAARSLAQTLYTHKAQLVYGGGTTGLMGEIAKTFVTLAGPQNVHGIIPQNVLGPEDHASVKASNRQSQSMGRTLKQRLGLAQKGMKDKKSAKSPAPTSTMLSENVYGRTEAVTDLPARKKRMCQLVNEGAPGSGFIALSGGFGTMDELMEMITLRQYGIHTRRICLLNIDEFWNPLLLWIEAAVEKGFIRAGAMETLAVRETADECLAWLSRR